MDELLNNQIHVLNSKTKRQELNNFIIRFSNFLTSVPVKIDLQQLDNVKDEAILGIKEPCIEEDLDEVKKVKKSSLYTDEQEGQTGTGKVADYKAANIP